MTILNQYAKRTEFTISRYSLERTLKALNKLEALALIRAAYKEADGGYASLEHAKQIYALVTARS